MSVADGPEELRRARERQRNLEAREFQLQLRHNHPDPSDRTRLREHRCQEPKCDRYWHTGFDGYCVEHWSQHDIEALTTNEQEDVA